jgi:hypothetical protein
MEGDFNWHAKVPTDGSSPTRPSRRNWRRSRMWSGMTARRTARRVEPLPFR